MRDHTFKPHSRPNTKSTHKLVMRDWQSPLNHCSFMLPYYWLAGSEALTVDLWLHAVLLTLHDNHPLIRHYGRLEALNKIFSHVRPAVIESVFALRSTETAGCHPCPRRGHGHVQSPSI